MSQDALLEQQASGLLSGPKMPSNRSMKRLKQWLRTLWADRPLRGVAPLPPQAGADLEELKRLIETADPRAPEILEQIAARLGQTDLSALSRRD